MNKNETLAYEYLRIVKNKNPKIETRLGYPDFITSNNEHYEIKSVSKLFFTKAQLKSFREITGDINIILMFNNQIIGEFKLNKKPLEGVEPTHIISISASIDDDKYIKYVENKSIYNKLTINYFRGLIKEEKERI